MLKKFILLILIIGTTSSLGLSVTKTPKLPEEKAVSLVRAALEAMGGEAKIRALSSITFDGIGHQYAVEQSERPAGPYIVTYNQVKEIRDLQNQRLRQSSESKQGQFPDWSGYDLVVANGAAAMMRGGREVPGNIVQIENAKMQFALAPERIFLTALEAKDLRLDKDIMLQDVNQRIIKFTWQNVPVTIYLNANTNLPTAVETLSASPYEHFWSIWGDFTTRTFYSYWTLEPGGIRYPRQRDTERNNYSYDSFTITDLKMNAPLSADSFKISDETRKAFAAYQPMKIDELPLGIAARPAAEIAPGIIKVPGRWDIAYVRQPDGIVIIESPISSGYSVKVLEEAKKRFPNEKIKAVVTTSDAFPHLGGIREYAAQGVPIYALDVNRPIIERVLAAPHKIHPDSEERRPRSAKITFIAQKTVLGSGTNRMEIYPFRTETGERMMMLYFPEHKLLYTSDLIQRQRDGSFFMTQYLSEAMDAVKRENLTVENIFGMHTDKTAWSDVTNAVAKQLKGAAD